MRPRRDDRRHNNKNNDHTSHNDERGGGAPGQARIMYPSHHGRTLPAVAEANQPARIPFMEIVEVVEMTPEMV
jgi:hypothetical protein